MRYALSTVGGEDITVEADTIAGAIRYVESSTGRRVQCGRALPEDEIYVPDAGYLRGARDIGRWLRENGGWGGHG